MMLRVSLQRQLRQFIAGMAGGLRASGPKADIALIVAENSAVVGGAFTTNVMCAAPVTYCREVLAKQETCRAVRLLTCELFPTTVCQGPCTPICTCMQVLINAGQANAATGAEGYQDCLKSAEAVAQALGIAAGEVLLLSTGVIGRPLKMDALLSSVPKLAGSLGSSPEHAHHAAVAITTTDLVSKSAALEVECAALRPLLISAVAWHDDEDLMQVSIGGHTVRMGGIAKGSGMIHPNMATMLSVITTDAAVAPDVWRGIIQRGAINSFNQVLAKDVTGWYLFGIKSCCELVLCYCR